MTPEEIHIKYARLVDLIRKMRGWQREYRKYHARGDLPKMRHYERQVDALIDAEVKAAAAKQKQLF